MARYGNKEKSLLLSLAGGPLDRLWLNEVVLTKALGDGYAEVYAETMIRITNEGLARLDRLQD